MLFLLPLIAAGVLGVGLAASVNKVPPVHRGILVRFDQRRRELDEGWHGLWDGVLPFVDRVEIEPVDLTTITVRAEVLSKDDLKLVISGSVQFRVDDLMRHSEVSADSIRTGMSDAIESELGVIAGKVEALDFRKQRREIQNLINAVLRLSNPPHYCAAASRTGGKPDAYDPARGLVGTEEIEPERRLRFYLKNNKAIRGVLGAEARNPNDCSVIERRYGIDVVVFELAEVAFTPDTLKALERRRQAELEGDAAQAQFRKQMEIFRELKDEVGPEKALNEASLLVGGKTTRQVFALEGLPKELLDRFLGTRGGTD